MFFTLCILLPIAVVIDVSEKVDKFLRHDDLGIGQIIQEYYVNFVIYYGNTFLPLATFIACIMFTSKLAGNTEIIAISSANISFTRFLRPYFVGATILALIALGMNHFVVPRGNNTRNTFEQTYLKRKKDNLNYVRNFNLQLNDSAKIFIKSFSLKNNKGYNFSYTEFDDIKVKYKLVADNVTWDEVNEQFIFGKYRENYMSVGVDSLATGKNKKMSLDFTPDDLIISGHKSQEMNSIDLYRFIKKSERRGVKNLNEYYMEFYQRTSLPISAYILTLIAVSLASRKKRGGIGVNLAVGIALMFIYVFFMKVAMVLGSAPDSNTFFMAWLPNLLFSIVAIYLYLKEKNQG